MGPLGCADGEEWTPIEEGAASPPAPPALHALAALSVGRFERDGEGVEFFVVRVELQQAGVAYELRRRFSQFEALARSMRAAVRRHSLPPKTIRHTDENIQARGVALEAWLHSLLSDQSAGVAADVQTYLRPFLELDAARALLEQHAREGIDHDLTAELSARRARSAERSQAVERLEMELVDKVRATLQGATPQGRTSQGSTLRIECHSCAPQHRLA
jgi:hypothetical protein